MSERVQPKESSALRLAPSVGVGSLRAFDSLAALASRMVEAAGVVLPESSNSRMF